jgi:thiol:disulfide interchange protein DsbC
MLKKVLLFSLLSLSISTFAEEKTLVSSQEKNDVILKDIESKFKNYFSGDIINYIADANLPNSYLVLLNDGTSLIYFKDTDYAVVGDLYDLSKRKNLSSTIMAGFNKSVLEKVIDKGIDLPVTPNVEKLDTVYVFTDPSCGYCRKLNHERDDYAKLGINLVYLPYSRSGENTESYNELIDVWCSKDKVKAMDLAKTDKGAEIKTLEGYNVTEECKKVVAEGEFYGRVLGVKGTPSMFASNGQAFPGYLPANQLKEYLLELKEESKEQTKK